MRAAPAAAPGQLSHGPVRRQRLVARRRAGRGNHSRRWRSRGRGPAGPAGTGGRRGQAGRQVELLAGPAAPGPRPGPAPGAAAAAAHWPGAAWLLLRPAGTPWQLPEFRQRRRSASVTSHSAAQSASLTEWLGRAFKLACHLQVTVLVTWL